MKTPQIIEVDLANFYFHILRKIVNAYRYNSLEYAEEEILKFIDIYESFIGDLDEESEHHG